MQSGAVIEADDVVGDVIFRFRLVGIGTLPDPLHYEIQEEAFGDCVGAVLRLPTISTTAHAADEALLSQECLVLLTGVLAATVAMDD